MHAGVCGCMDSSHNLRVTGSEKHVLSFGDRPPVLPVCRLGPGCRFGQPRTRTKTGGERKGWQEGLVWFGPRQTKAGARLHRQVARRPQVGLRQARAEMSVDPERVSPRRGKGGPGPARQGSRPDKLLAKRKTFPFAPLKDFADVCACCLSPPDSVMPQVVSLREGLTQLSEDAHGSMIILF